jgi:hypothetical protein
LLDHNDVCLPRIGLIDRVGLTAAYSFRKRNRADARLGGSADNAGDCPRHFRRRRSRSRLPFAVVFCTPAFTEAVRPP